MANLSELAAVVILEPVKYFLNIISSFLNELLENIKNILFKAF